MSIEGVSMANMGMPRDVTPAEVAVDVTRLSQQKAEASIKDIEESEESKKLKSGDEDENEDNESHSKYDARSYDDDSEDNEQEELFAESDVRRYRVKLNKDVDLIELVDTKTKKVIETITPSDLMKLLSKSKNPSGVLVDRKI